MSLRRFDVGDAARACAGLPPARDLEPVAAAPGGVLYEGDCLDVLYELPAGSVDLVYADPPFGTGQRWVGRAGEFDDRWPDMATYIRWMRERAVQMHRVLAPTGQLWLHCDDHSNAYLALMLDSVFGLDQCIGDVRWRRSAGARNTPRKSGFPRTLDTLLVYARGETWTFHQQDPPLDSVWTDITLGSAARERTGYPTQKPEALLERIILVSSNPGDVVLDPFCGSGTTCAVAQREWREWIGIDESPDAIAVAAKRLGASEAVAA